MAGSGPPGKPDPDWHDMLGAGALPHGGDSAVRRGSEAIGFGRNIHESVANLLGSEIISEVHPPGTLLPSELQLRERFSVSRTTLREAFRVLTAKGLIVSRPKVGTRVRPKSDWNMLDPEVLAWHLQTQPTEGVVTDLFALREMVEPAAAALAATRRHRVSVERVAAAYAEMARLRDRAGEVIAADLEFHLAILEATGNLFIGALGSLIHAALIGSFKLGWQSPAGMQESRLLQHRAVLDAIAAGDAEGARSRMTELLQGSIGDVRKYLEHTQSARSTSRDRR